MTTTTRTNKYAATCASCDTHIPAGTGRLSREDGQWITQCMDADACTANTEAKYADREARLTKAEEMAKAEYARRKAAGESPSWLVLLAQMQQQVLPQPSAPAKSRTNSRRTSASHRRACVSGGNCSSTTGRDCGGFNCDAN